MTLGRFLALYRSSVSKRKICEPPISCVLSARPTRTHFWKTDHRDEAEEEDDVVRVPQRQPRAIRLPTNSSVSSSPKHNERKTHIVINPILLALLSSQTPREMRQRHAVPQTLFEIADPRSPKRCLPRPARRDARIQPLLRPAPPSAPLPRRRTRATHSAT